MNKELIEKLAPIIEKYRNDETMTSHQIALQITKEVNVEVSWNADGFDTTPIPYPSPEEAGKEMESAEKLKQKFIDLIQTPGFMDDFEIADNCVKIALEFANQSRPQPLNEEEINELAHEYFSIPKNKRRSTQGFQESDDEMRLRIFKAGIHSKAVPGSDAIAFGKWLKHSDNGTEHYNPHTKEVSDSIGFSPYDCFMDDIMTVEELYKKFKY